MVLVNPKGASNSDECKRVMKIRGLNRHTVSTYLVTPRWLSKIDINQHELS